MTAATATATEKAMVGQPAPNFDMASTKNIEKLNEGVKLEDYKGRWVVLLFYPLDFTFVCPTELTAFSDRYEEFQRHRRRHHRRVNRFRVFASRLDQDAARQRWRRRIGLSALPLTRPRTCRVTMAC